MEKLQEYLCNLADNLDQNGEFNAADAVAVAIKNNSLVKTAQYCGFGGYTLRQNRALSNCFRKKRAKDSNQPIQEVVFECLREYNDAQNFYETEWREKYAAVISASPKHLKTAHVVLLEAVSEENKIPEQVDILRSCVKKTDDELIKKVLSDYDLITSFVKGDIERSADSQRPFFKEAGPKKWWRGFSDWAARIGNDDKYTSQIMRDINNNLSEYIQTARSMRSAIVELQSSLPLVIGKNLFQNVISELDFNNYRRAYPAIINLFFQIKNHPFKEISEPSGPEEVFVQTIQKEGKILTSGPAVLENNKEEILNLLNELSKRKAFSDVSNYDVISSIRHLDFFYKVLNYLFDNPFNSKYMEYVYEIFSRLRYSINNLENRQLKQEARDRRNLMEMEMNENEYGPFYNKEDESPTEEETAKEETTGEIPDEIAQRVRNDWKINNSIENITKAAAHNLSQAQIEEFITTLSSIFNVTIPDIDQDLATIMGIEDPVRRIKSSLQEISKERSKSKGVSTPSPETSPPTAQNVKREAEENANTFNPRKPKLGSPVDVDQYQGIFSQQEQSAYNIDSFIKLSDFIDKINPKIARIIDHKILMSSSQ